MLKAYRIYIKKYISTLRLTYEKPTAFAICASRFDFRPCRFCALHAFLNQAVTQLKEANSHTPKKSDQKAGSKKRCCSGPWSISCHCCFGEFTGA
ncbi:hypothetical protein Hanom_Chr16g01420451 [Helianthus anomalus]